MKNKLSILAILVLGALMIAFIQTRTITGKVIDNSGLPLAGVNVTVKGTSRGTITDQQGNYKIELAPDDKILQFSKVGYYNN